MDQPKVERMLRLMQLLSGNVYYTIGELGEKLELSRRTLFRYFDTFKSAGFVVQNIGDGRYRMTTYNKEYSELSQLVYFSEEEAIVVSHLIENLDAANALKAGLKQKLAAVYDSTSISDYIEIKGKSEIVETLANAVKSRRAVALNGYASAHSGQT
ncbi:MAG: transcriptional regulator, partial [Bacteroidales bacterium]|nr:transcriptional regulator [Bacteroidales bacterium]